MHDLSHPADAARDLGAAVCFALGDAAHQVDDAAVRDDLDLIREQVLGVGGHRFAQTEEVGETGLDPCPLLRVREHLLDGPTQLRRRG